MISNFQSFLLEGPKEPQGSSFGMMSFVWMAEAYLLMLLLFQGSSGQRRGRWTYTVQGKCQLDKWFIEGTQASQLHIVFCIRELGEKQPSTGIKTSLYTHRPLFICRSVETESPKGELQSLKGIRRDHRN